MRLNLQQTLVALSPIRLTNGLSEMVAPRSVSGIFSLFSQLVDETIS